MWNKQEIYRALQAQSAPLLGNLSERAAAVSVQPWCAAQLDLMRTRAQEACGKPAPALCYSLFRRYWETGDRAAYENVYFERRTRLLCFSLLAWLSPEQGRWIPALEDMLWEICAEPFWCLPAHFMGPNDEKLPFSAYETTLDLFACETGFALAECLALHGDALAPDVARQVRAQLQKRVFAPFADAGILHRFETMPNNWSAVCASAVGGAALHCVEDQALLCSILHRALSCQQVYLSSFGGDGLSVEGAAYWTYGFGFFVCFADLLRTRTAGALDLLAFPKVERIAKSQQHYFLTGNTAVSFGDAHPTDGFRMGLSCYLQRRFADANFPQAVYADHVLTDRCARFCLALRDFLWYEPDARFGLPQDESSWLPDAQWLISRARPFALAIKGGHNGESHNHNDCGGFLLCKNGVPLLCDIGAGRYDGNYFSPRRYECFVAASRSHNVPLIGGAGQEAGATFAARDVTAQVGERDTFSAELAGCYAQPALQSARRSLVHEKAAHRVVLTDTFVCTTPQSVTETFVSGAPIRLEEGCAVFSAGGESVCLHYDAQQFAPELTQQSYDAFEGGTATAYILSLQCRAPAEKLQFTAVLSDAMTEPFEA